MIFADARHSRLLKSVMALPAKTSVGSRPNSSKNGLLKQVPRVGTDMKLMHLSTNSCLLMEVGERRSMMTGSKLYRCAPPTPV